MPLTGCTFGLALSRAHPVGYCDRIGTIDTTGWWGAGAPVPLLAVMLVLYGEDGRVIRGNCGTLRVGW